MSIVLPNKKDLSERVKAYRNHGYNIVTFGTERVEMEDKNGDFVVLETRRSVKNAPKDTPVKTSKTADEIVKNYPRYRPKKTLAQRVDDIVYKTNPDDYNKSFKTRAEGLKVAEEALKTPEGRKAVIEELESYLKPGDADTNEILSVRNDVMDLQYKNMPRPPKIGYKMPTQSQLNRGFRR